MIPVQNVPPATLLDALCPMHLRVSPTGHVLHVGPTLRKLRPGRPWIGARVLELLRIVRPKAVSSMAGLGTLAGRQLHFELRDPPRTTLKGVALADPETGGMLVNLAFGISIHDAVRDFDLTQADFAATDMAIEMLYLIEATSAAMRANKKVTLKLRDAKIEAEKQAFTDMLTGLANRRAMDMALSRIVATHQPLALMHVDLDFFKAVNDTLGHAAGDHVLLQVADAFRKVTRETDVVARIGGDEFVLLLPDLTDREVIDRMGARIIAALEKPIAFQGHVCRISGSIGTAVWDGTRPTSPDTLLDDADIALYASKRSGRGRHTFYAPRLREEAQIADGTPGGEVELWGAAWCV